MNCGAYEGGTAISSDGKYYPCHRFVGMEDFVLEMFSMELQREAEKTIDIIG